MLKTTLSETNLQRDVHYALDNIEKTQFLLEFIHRCRGLQETICQTIGIDNMCHPSGSGLDAFFDTRQEDAYPDGHLNGQEHFRAMQQEPPCRFFRQPGEPMLGYTVRSVLFQEALKD